uniref:2'-5'-oligoadenylate synthetase 1 domain-containing protein n=1 Tax=Gopherus evgoodei TaxID=1825980 RepID=A0A8C4WNI3_9SAUR
MAKGASLRRRSPHCQISRLCPVPVIRRRCKERAPQQCTLQHRIHPRNIFYPILTLLVCFWLPSREGCAREVTWLSGRRVEGPHIAQHPGIVERVGSSAGKGTALKNNSDADLVLFLSCFSSYRDQMENRVAVLDTIKQKLNQTPLRSVCGDPSSTLSSRAGDSWHQTFPPGLRGSDSGQSRAGEFCTSFTELQRDFVKCHPAKLKNLLRLVKHWYKEVRCPALPQSVIPPSPTLAPSHALPALGLPLHVNAGSAGELWADKRTSHMLKPPWKKVTEDYIMVGGGVTLRQALMRSSDHRLDQRLNNRIVGHLEQSLTRIQNPLKIIEKQTTIYISIRDRYKFLIESKFV